MNNKHTVSLLEGLNTACYKLDQELVDFYTTYAEKAASSEIVFVTLGRNSGEGGDRVVDNDFNLATEEIQMLDKISKVFHAFHIFYNIIESAFFLVMCKFYIRNIKWNGV